MGVFNITLSRAVMFRHVFVFALFSCAILVAGAPSKAADDYGSRIDAAREYIASNGMERGLNQQIAKMIANISAQLRKNYPDANAGKIDEIANTVLAEFESRVPELLDDAARVYAQHFTSRELKEMTRYNKSPVGQKLQEKQSVIGREMSEAFDLWLTRVSYNAAQRMEELLADTGSSTNNNSQGYGY